MQFTFPLDIEVYRTITSKAELIEMLMKDAKNNNLSALAIYTIKNPCPAYIYAKCKYCQAELRFARNQDNYFELRKVKILHQHKRIRTQNQILKNIIKQLPENLNAITVKSIINKQFSLSNSKFYRLFSAVRNESIDLEELVEMFNGSGFIGYYEPLNVDKHSLPTMLITTNLIAKAAFSQFGSVVSFDFTYNIFRQKSPNNLDYRLGILAGLSSSMKLISFASVIVEEESAETIAKIFYEMFRLLGNAPEVIISDEQASIRAGLNILNYQGIWNGVHLLDSFHILKNLRKNLKNKENISFFKNIMFARSQNEYEHYCNEAEENLNEAEAQLLERLKERSRQICYSQLPSDLFIGFGITSSTNQKLNDLVKQMIPKSLKVLSAAKKISKYFYHLATKSFNQCQFQNDKAENYMMMNQLKYTRKQVCKKVFRGLTENIIKSTRCTIHQNEEEQSYEVYDRFGINLITKKENLFECSCHFKERSGIPCEHLIRLLMLKGQKFQLYISQRWKFYEKIEKYQSQIKIKPPTKTRRNRIK